MKDDIGINTCFLVTSIIWRLDFSQLETAIGSSVVVHRFSDFVLMNLYFIFSKMKIWFDVLI